MFAQQFTHLLSYLGRCQGRSGELRWENHRVGTPWWGCCSTSCPGALGGSSGAAGSLLSHCSGACVYCGVRPLHLSLWRTGAAAEAPCCTWSHCGLPKCCYGLPLRPPQQGSPSCGMGGQGWNSPSVAAPHVPAPKGNCPEHPAPEGSL